MSKESLLTRMLCSAARVDSQRFRAGYLTQDERRKLNKPHCMNWWIRRSTSTTRPEST